MTLTVPDYDAYRRHLSPTLFRPWLVGEFAEDYARVADRTLVSADRCHVLYTLLRQATRLPGEVWECGTYRGGTAALMARALRRVAASATLRVFDTFAGLPEADPSTDLHAVGDFDDADLGDVRRFIDYAALSVHPGVVPDTFLQVGAEARIAFLHVDLDTYRSTLACLEGAWPRVLPGGIVVDDDYGFPTCPGARRAVDEFFCGKACVPLCLPTGQAVVFKGVP